MGTSLQVHLSRASVGCLLFTLPVSSWYLPGLAPLDYAEGSYMDLKVNKLTSVGTQLPYSYYALPYCRPRQLLDAVENLGETLQGNVIQNSDYEIQMQVNKTCALLCKRRLSDLDKASFRRMIDDKYMVNFMLDNLPASTLYSTVSGRMYNEPGFPVGLAMDGKYHVHNHVRMTLFFHTSPYSYVGARFVGFEIEPQSFAYKDVEQGPGTTPWAEEDSELHHVTVLPNRKNTTERESEDRYHISRRAAAQAQCGELGHEPFDLDQADEIIFTYEVTWLWSPVRWSSRWDNYLKVTGAAVHWSSILNSAVIALFCLCVVAAILVRTLRGSISMHNAQELSGDRRWRWTVLCGDVFRPPRHAKLLAISVGSGLQVLATTVGTLALALLGLLSPARRGSLLQSMLLLYCFSGAIAGYVSSRLVKAMGGEDDWRRTAAWTATAYPGICFVIFFVLNLLNFSQKASSAVPVSTIASIFIIWGLLCVPSACLGSYIGARQPPVKLPRDTRPEPRRIPRQPWYRSLAVSMAVGGIIPFSIAFTELFFVINSIWQHEYYVTYGFLALMVVLFAITSVEVAVIFTYLQLNAENHHWWWRSFLSTAASGAYVFLYSILYFLARLELKSAASVVLYFGFMFMISGVFSLVGGACGMLASHAFVRVIYGSIRAREVDLCSPGDVQDVQGSGGLELRTSRGQGEGARTTASAQHGEVVRTTVRAEATLPAAEGASAAAEEAAAGQRTEQGTAAGEQGAAAAS